MPDSDAPAAAFSTAARAGFLTLSPLLLPTHFHEEPKTYYRVLYHRIKARRGAKKAIVAVQHAMVVALWHMLKRRVAHHDLGPDYFERRNTERLRRHHVRRLERLGYGVVLVEKVA